MQQQHPSRVQPSGYPQLQRTYGSMDSAYGSPVHAYSPASASASPTAHATHSFLYSQQQQHQGVHNGLNNDHSGIHQPPMNPGQARMSLPLHDQQQRQYHQQIGPNGSANGNMNPYPPQQPHYAHQVPLQAHHIEQSHQPVRPTYENSQSVAANYWNQPPKYHQVPLPKQHLSPLDAYLLARALQTAGPGQEQHQIVLFTQSNHKNPQAFLQAYQQNKHEIDELVAQLRREESSGNVEQHHHQQQPYGYAPSYPSAPHSSSSLNGTPAHQVVQIPPAIVPLPGAMNSHGVQARPGGGGGGMHGMHSSVPTSAPASYNSFPFNRNSSFSTDMDLPSEASSPMLETPTSASLPTSANTASAMYKPSSAGGYKSPAIASQQPQVPIASAPPTSPKKTSIGGGSREGEPYNEEEIRLIEEVIREAVQNNPDIKMAQLGQLIHDRDPTRPATAWSRQLSKRKQAIDKARELARSGKSVANFPIDTNNRKGRAYAETDTDGESVSLPARGRAEKDDDDDYDDRPAKRRRGL